MQKILSLAILILIVSCGGSGMEGYVGESITISAENPEEGVDVDYIWVLANQPDGSLMNSKDLFASDIGNKMTFIPDYPGDYSVQVSISQYGDEISNQSFSFTILDPENKESTEETLDENSEEEWLNEDLQEETEIAYEEDGKDSENEKGSDEEIEVEIDEYIAEEENYDDVADEENEAPVIKVTVPTAIKATTKKPLKGTSIAAKTDRYTIQITSKRILKDAQLFSQKMINKGYDSYIQKVVFNMDEIWYRVRVGSYDNYQSAKEAADNLSGEIGMATWVDFVRIE
tara:strand:+ start:1045 stop:1905 length:861 start_codon:yes stop_codon:yes gene_type:complete